MIHDSNMTQIPADLKSIKEILLKDLAVVASERRKGNIALYLTPSRRKIRVFVNGEPREDFEFEEIDSAIKVFLKFSEQFDLI